MIFGSVDFQKELFETIRDIEVRKNFTVLYIGTVGSISCGLSDKVSDYDVKCLFIRKNSFIDKSDKHNEEKIRFREFNTEKVYECIAFWEISAFINFLAEPFIDSGNKYDLWRNVMWLFMTPYAWDPLGLREKIRYDLLSCMNLQNELLHHYNIMDKLFSDKKADGNYNRKEFSRLLHAFLSIQWIRMKNELPPLNLFSLLSITSDQRINDFYVENLINDYKSLEKNENSSVGERWNNKEYIYLIKRITCMYENLKPDYQNKTYDFSSLDCNQKFVDRILNTIHYSLKKIPYIENVGLKDYRDINLKNFLKK